MKIFLSSTAEDLIQYRKVAVETFRRLGFESVAMEDFGPRPNAPIDECERLAGQADILVCIVAHRYGSVPENGRGSFTQREVEAARQAGKDVLVWIVADAYEWSGLTEQDLLTDPNVLASSERVANVTEAVAALVHFKEWLRKTFVCDEFTTPQDLRARIAEALAKYVPHHNSPAIPQDRISISRLPITSSELFGREVELKILDDAWTNPQTNIVSFVAWGGVGKTALVNHWLKHHMARDKFRGAERVYGWSFFSQGTNERAASADLFIDQALRWFGDPDPTAGSPWDKGARLARYIRYSRTLLILDGLEPLQHPPGFQEGRLKDAGMQALLVELAAHQPGLSVISTRERVGDLVEFENSTVTQHSLDHLSPQAGAQILNSLNVNGDVEELEQAAKELDGHAFSLTLLGSYLDEVLDGDIRRRHDIENLFDDTRYGDSAQKMIGAYEKWLGEGMEVAILRLLGLFDRPADLSSLSAVRERPAISGLTESLQHFKAREWNQAIAKLRRIKLLAGVSTDDPGSLDAHPLVRHYFKQQLQRNYPNAWRLANGRLFDHLKKSAKQFPDTLEEMSSLFAAVAHGCSAGRHKEVLSDVFLLRIQRGSPPFSINKLGAVGANLAALACFFEVPWYEFGKNLSEDEKGFLLGAAGFCLDKTGRLQEAAAPMRTALKIFISINDQSNAARVANNASELYLKIGNFTEALELAELGVKLADQRKDSVERITLRATLADVLHQTGQLQKSAATFEEAEKLQSQLLPQFNFLFSSEGFSYCDLLLDLGKIKEVKERAAYALNLSKKTGNLLMMGLDNLSLGRAWLLESQKTHDFSHATQLLQDAVDILRQAGDITFLTMGLLGRAILFRNKSEFELASKQLLEVSRIINRTGMALCDVDYNLECAQLFLAQSENEKAYEYVTIGKEKINRIGYHRRDAEVAEIEAQLA